MFSVSRKALYNTNTMKKYIVEFIGTFFLVLTVALTGNPIAIGFILVAMVYMGGYISGAHYNTAVTMGLLLSGNIKWIEAKNIWRHNYLVDLLQPAYIPLLKKTSLSHLLGRMSAFSVLL